MHVRSNDGFRLKLWMNLCWRVISFHMAPYVVCNRCSQKRGSECANDWAAWTSRCKSGILISPERCSHLELQSGSIEKLEMGTACFHCNSSTCTIKAGNMVWKGFITSESPMSLKVRERSATPSIREKTWEETKMGDLKNRAVTNHGGCSVFSGWLQVQQQKQNVFGAVIVSLANKDGARALFSFELWHLAYKYYMLSCYVSQYFL